MQTMQFTTPIEIPTSPARITHKSNIILAGSCFAENIGGKLAERKFNICINPFGILYNPLSITAMLERIAKCELFTAESPEIFKHNEKWHSHLHHGDFSRSTKEELLTGINAAIDVAHKKVSTCDYVILTLGTAYAYYLNSNNNIVGNCHKLPGNLFTRRMLDISEIVAAMTNTMELYTAANPDIKFIFTVSPIRHLRDGAHDNQKSKGTLLLAIDKIMKQFPHNTHYFPAYEIMLDELRDYRFYAADMVHPSQVAVDYIWEKFGSSWFTGETHGINREIEDINKAIGHKPYDPQASAYKQFLKNTLNRIETVLEKHPGLDFEKEIMQCNILLNR